MKNRLRELRIEKRLTTRELADIYGVSHASISRAETGDRNLNDEDIQFFTEFFECSSDYLLGISDVRNVPSSENVKLAFYNQQGIVNEKQRKMVEDFIEMIKKADSNA